MLSCLQESPDELDYSENPPPSDKQTESCMQEHIFPLNRPN